MKNIELYKISNGFYNLSIVKFAGIFQAAPKLVEDLTVWALEKYASRIWGEFQTIIDDNEKKLKDMKHINDRYGWQQDYKSVSDSKKYNLLDQITNPPEAVEIIIENIIKKIDQLTYENTTLQFSDYSLPIDLAYHLKITKVNKKAPLNKKLKMFEVEFIEKKTLNQLQLNNFLRSFVKPKLIKTFYKIMNYRDSIYNRYGNNFEGLIESENRKYQEVIDFCKEFTDSSDYKKDYRESITFKVKDLIEGFKYIKDLGDVNPEQTLLCELYFDRSKANRDTGEDGFNGLWDSDFKTITIIADINEILKYKKYITTNIIKTTFNNLISTIRHECQHQAQSLLEEVKELKEIPGIPSKNIRYKDVAPEGKVVGKKEKVMHALRDIEFYTRLADSVDDFNQDKQKYLDLIDESNDKEREGIKEVLYSYAKYLSGIITRSQFIKDRFKYEEDEFAEINKIAVDFDYYFFRMLKEHQPEKWKKAVKEFFKAIDL